MFQTITDEPTFDEKVEEMNNDPVRIMAAFLYNFAENIEPLLKDKQLVEWNRLELENMVMKLTEGITR